MADEPLQLGPHATWEELARAYAVIAATTHEGMKQIPLITVAVERIEAATLVASGAAHRALDLVSRLERRVGGAEVKADVAHDAAREARDEAFRSSSNLEEYLAEAAAETGRILDRRAKDPNDRLDSDRARAIAEKVVADAREAAAIGAKVEAYEEIQRRLKKRRERLWGIAWKAAGALATAAALGAGALLWGQFQRAAGRAEGAQVAGPLPATSSPPVVPLPFEPPTNPAAPRAMLPDAGRKP